MAAIGAPEAMTFGGAQSQGPALGIYRAKVSDTAADVSKNSGRPFIQLTFIGHSDPDHPAKNGKKIISKRFYGAMKTDDADKVKTMNGMLNRALFKPFGIPWPKDAKKLDPRIFANKVVYIVIGEETDKKSGDVSNTIVAMAADKKMLPKAALDGSMFKKKGVEAKKEEGEEAVEEAPVAEEVTEEGAEEVESKPARRR